MKLSDFLTEANVLESVASTDRWQAIEELLDNLIQTGRIPAEKRQEVLDVVNKREASMSTGIGFGIGIPHASTEHVQEVVGAFGRSNSGLDFEALDSQPVHLVLLFLVPQGKFRQHLHTLADIAKVLNQREFRDAVEQAENAAGIWDTIQKFTV